jgi:hypothetical protein
MNYMAPGGNLIVPNSDPANPWKIGMWKFISTQKSPPIWGAGPYNRCPFFYSNGSESVPIRMINGFHDSCTPESLNTNIPVCIVELQYVISRKLYEIYPKQIAEFLAGRKNS